MNLDCHGLSWAYSDGGVVLRALRTVDGGKELTAVPPPFDPYCYIESDGFDPHPFNASGARLADGAPDGYLKVEADTPSDLRSFRDAYPFETYESDVGFAQRVLIDTDVSLEPPDDVLYFDIEVDDRGGFEDASDADRVVVSIAGVPGDPGADPIYEDLASHGGEKELLEAFLGRADEYAALVGWNSEGYDFEYLENRCLEHGLDVDWRRWVRLDAMPLYDMLGVPTKTVSTNLDDTAERELGVGKTGVEAGGGEIWRLHEEDPGALREYNIRDCELVRDIDDKFSLLEILYVVCDLCNYPPGDACYQTKHGQVRFAIGQVVDGKILEVARRRGVPQHDSGAFDKPPGFPGGYVLDPVPGLYEDVVAPDYSGMYPNIVRAWNFGRETFVPEEVPLEEGDDGVWRATAGEHAGRRVIRAETGAFVHPADGPRSIPAQAADELVRMREGAREILDKGVKAVNNCFSGDTEVMTPDRGPVNIAELEVGDRVYSIDPDTLRCEIKPVVETTAEPNAYGELVHIDGEGVDLKVTPNHRMLVSEYRAGDYEFHEARDLEAGRYDLPTHQPVAGREPDKISLMNCAEGRVLVDHDCHGHTFKSHINEAEYAPNRGGYWLEIDAFNEQEADVRGLGDVVGVQHHANGKITPLCYDPGNLLELIGWYVAEGCLNAADSTRIQIAQANDGGRSRISELLADMGVPHRVYDAGVRISDENLAEWLGEECGRTSQTKRIPDWAFDMDHTLLARLHGALMAGDGSDVDGSVKYTTISDDLRDDFARLLVHLGKKFRFREDGAHRVHENRTDGVAGPRNVSRERHDGMVYCVSVLDNHTVLAGRNGTMQWTGQTLYGIFASDRHRYFGPFSENITLIGQELTGKVEEIAGSGHTEIDNVIYGDTDSIMVSMADPDDPIEAAHRVSDDVEAAMKEWAAGRGANADYLELDVDDVYERFYIGDKKKRYFGRRIYDGEPCDNFKVRGFEARQGDWPEPVREFQEELMHAVLEDEPTRPIVEEAREALFAGRFDPELATSTSLSKPLEEYDVKLPHTRAAEALREEFDRGAADVGDKINYIKYANANEAVTWVRDGEPGRDFRPNEGWCPECGEVVRDPHPHETEAYPHFREQHYGYLWEKKFASVAGSIGVDTSRGSQTGLGDYQ